jgi:hypothetical protein
MAFIRVVDRLQNEVFVADLYKTRESKRSLLALKEDTIIDLRHKIALATEIPIYAQHLYVAHTIQPFYHIYGDNYYRINVNPEALFEVVGASKLNLDIPFDQLLFDNKFTLRIQSNEHVMLVSDIPVYTPIIEDVVDPRYIDKRVVYVADMREFLEPIKRALLINNALIEFVYYGFVVKYWPMTSIDLLRDYVFEGEEYILSRYPALVSNWDYWFDQTEMLEALNAVKRPEAINMTINSAVMTNRIFLSPVNVLNIFDLYETSDDSPSIRYVDAKSIITCKERYHAMYDINVNFPSQFMSVPSSVTILIITAEKEHIYLSIEEMSYSIKMIIFKQKLTSFPEYTTLIRKYVNPIIAQINSKLEFISANPIPEVSEHNSTFSSIDLTLYWIANTTAAGFEYFKSLIEARAAEGIFQLVDYGQNSIPAIMSNSTAVYFTKGPVGNPTAIDNKAGYYSNYYARFTSNDAATQWQMTYHGFLVKINHTYGDIRLLVNNIKEFNVILLRRYMAALVTIFRDKIIGQGKRSIHVKKLRKLHEYDPVLYNLRDSKLQNAGKGNLYSVICQEPNQPIIYSADELEDLSSVRRKKIYEYWNFTLDAPAYYECPNPNYPNLMFLVNKHPDKYCIPCCKKRSVDKIRKNVDIFKQCIAKHLYDPKNNDSANTTTTVISPQAYIFDFTQSPLAPGRLGRIPLFDSFLDLFARHTSSIEISLPISQGVEQISVASKNFGFIKGLQIIFAEPTIKSLVTRLASHASPPLRRQIEETWMRSPSQVQIHMLDWITLFSALAAREYDTLPIIVDIRDGGLHISHLLSTRPSHVCFLLRKTNEYTGAIAYEPIVVYLADMSAQHTSIWPLSKQFAAYLSTEAPTKLCDRYILHNDTIIGGIRMNEYIPAHSVALKEDSTPVELADLIEENSRPIFNGKLPADAVIHATGPDKPWAAISPTEGLILIDKMPEPAKSPLLSPLPSSAAPIIWKYPIKSVLRAEDDDQLVDRRYPQDDHSDTAAPADDERIKSLAKSSYRVNFYQMVLIEFIKNLNLEKDIPRRRRLAELIQNNNINIATIRTIITNAKDVFNLNRQIQQYTNKDELLAQIDRSIYHFDRQTHIFSLNHHDQRQLIERILEKFLIVVEDADLSQANFNTKATYTPHKVTMYTAIVGPRAKLIDMLLADMRNPLKQFIFMSDIKVKPTIAARKFKKRPGEVIYHITQ